MTRKLAAICLPLACVLVAASPAAAAPTKPLPALTPVRADALTRALARGQLTEAQYALERARSLFRPGAVRREFGDVAAPDPRAATPILRDLAIRLRFLSETDRTSARAILSRPTDGTFSDEHHYASGAIVETACDATRPLCFHWDANPVHRDAPPPADTSPANGIPDQVDRTMATFAGVYDLEVGTYGFQAPLPDTTSQGQTSSPETDIYLADLGGDSPALFGYCTTDDPHFVSPFSTYRYWDASAYCVVDNDFTNVVYGGIDPQDALDVTAAHEFFHAIQFHYDIGEDLWLMEGTAMVMEGQYRPDVKDRIRYLSKSTFTSPATPVDRGSGGFEYGAWIFWRFLIEDRGELANPLVIRQIWERVAGASTDTDGPGPDTIASDQYSLQGTKNVLTSRGLVFRNVFEKFAWVNRIPTSFYSEGADYPAAVASAGYTIGPSRPSTGWHSYKLRHLSDRYVVFKPSTNASTNMHIRVRVDLPNLAYGPEANLLVRYVGGTFRLQPITLDSAGNGTRVVSLGRGTVKEVDLVLTNASTRMKCWEPGTVYSCMGAGLDDLRTYSFRAAIS